MLNIEKATRLGAINDLVERVGFGGRRVGVEGDIFGGEFVVVSDIVAASLVANVLVEGAAVFGGGAGVVVSDRRSRLRLGLRFDDEGGGFRRWVGKRGFGFERKWRTLKERRGSHV